MAFTKKGLEAIRKDAYREEHREAYNAYHREYMKNRRLSTGKVGKRQTQKEILPLV